MLVATEMRTPTVRRLRFGGHGLADLPYFPGQDLMVELPGLTRVRRRYTIRHLDPKTATVDLDVQLHGHGPGSAWAAGAREGDRVEAFGPRGKIGLATGADWHLFCGDGSAVPAVLTMVEALPAGAAAIAVLQVTGEDEQQEPGPVAAALDLRWAHRSLELPAALPRGRGHAYLFGELSEVAAWRRAVLGLGLAPDQVDHKAYWRRGVANAPHGEPQRTAPTPP